MKKFKKVITLLLSCAMMLSMLNVSYAASDENEYVYYTSVGSKFVPSTDAVADGVTWTNGSTEIDTSVMGKRIISGTDSDSNHVKGIVNVGVQKYSAYVNAEDKTIGDTVLNYNTTETGQWRYSAADQSGTTVGTYAEKERVLGVPNNVLSYTALKDTATNGDYRNKPLRCDIPGEISSDFEVTFRTLAEGFNTDSAYQHQIAISDTSSTTVTATIVIQRNKSGTFSVKVNGGTFGTVYTDSENSDWLYLKVVYTDSDNTFTVYDLNNDGKKVDSVALASDFATLNYIDLRSTTKTGASATKIYLDDFTVTDLTSTDYIYYEEFENEYNYSYIQTDETENAIVDKDIALVDKDGNASGYTVPVYAKAEIDKSLLGTFKNTTALAGFDEPITINWTVYKEENAWFENFEGYQHSDIGTAPYIEPWSSYNDATGKTIALNPLDENDMVLKYVSNAKDGFDIFTDNKAISGKLTVSYSFMLSSIPAKGNIDLSVISDSGTAPLIQTYVEINDKGARMRLRNKGEDGASDTYKDIITYDSFEANHWYTVKFNIDTDNGVYTYSIDNSSESEEFKLYTQGVAFSYTRLAQRTGADTLNGEVTVYFDDLYVTKFLTVKEPISKQITVYKDDTITLPEKVEVMLSDDATVDYAQVVWNDSVDTSAVGEQIINGTVTGTQTEATLSVNVSAYPYEITAPVIKNADNTEIFGLIDGGSISAVTLKKISNETVFGDVYTALYDENGRLISVNLTGITNDTWNKDEKKDISVKLPFGIISDDGINKCVLKAFVINDTLTPLAEAYRISNADTQEKTTVYIAGDSTASVKPDSKAPETGWGEAFAQMCTDTGITVKNYALDGASSKSFADQGHLNEILENANAGDYMFIQFGHNDSKTDTYRYTNPDTTYKEYLTKYVIEAREEGVIPVILTSIVRAQYSEDGNFTGDTDGNLDKYASAAKEVAAEYHVPLIDLYALTKTAFEGKTKDEVLSYFDYETNGDTTHLNESGATLVANMIKVQMQNILIPIAKLFN